MDRVIFQVALIICSMAFATSSSWNSGLREYRNTGCSAVGQIICTDKCTKVSLCIGDGSGGFTTTPVESCSEDKRCSAESKRCVDTADSDCHELQDHFECHGTGFFPDPYNCSVYHLCTEVGQTSEAPLVCPGDWAYDPLTTDCSLTQNDRVCKEGPVPACTEIGQAGSIPENPTIYYICVRQNEQLVPQLHKCPHGEVWDDKHYQCVAHI